MTMSTGGEQGEGIDLNDADLSNADLSNADLNNADLNNDGVIDADEQLVLSEEEEALPWLEAEEEDENSGWTIGQIIGWALLGLLAIAVIFSAVWWLNNDSPDPSLAADGSTIEASDDPYKTRPDDAGGREVDGTGDTSFSVAEGENVDSSVGNGSSSSSSTNGSSSSSSSSATSGNSGSSAGQASASEGVGVQIGAFSTRASAQSGWSQLSGQYSALNGQKYRILEGTADSGTIYRLQAVAADAAAAGTLCRAIQSAGGDCQVKR